MCAREKDESTETGWVQASMGAGRSCRHSCCSVLAHLLDHSEMASELIAGVVRLVDGCTECTISYLEGECVVIFA